jgi:hypothetical protein
MAIPRNLVDMSKFNPNCVFPFELRREDFQMAMQDVYDFFYDVNSYLLGKGLQRLDDMLRSAIMSGVLSDMLTASLAKHSRVLTENRYFNGHPDLIVRGVYANDAARLLEKRVVPSTRMAPVRSGSASLSTIPTPNPNPLRHDSP